MAEDFEVTANMSGKKVQVSINNSMNVGDLKRVMEGPLGLAATQMRVIYKGRMTKDTDTVPGLGIAAGHAIHVAKFGSTAAVSGVNASGVGASGVGASGVGASGVSASSVHSAAPGVSAGASARSPSMPGVASSIGGNQANPFGQMPSAGANPFSGMDMSGLLRSLGGSGMMPPGAGSGSLPGVGASGMPGASGLPGGMNPEMLQSMMSNPMVQNMMRQMMSNPEMMRQMMASNPFLSGAQNDPAMSAVLNNPEMLNSVLGALGGGSGGNNNLGASDASNLTASNPNMSSGGGGADMFSNMARSIQDPEVQASMRQMMSSFGGGADGANNMNMSQLLGAFGGQRGGTGPGASAFLNDDQARDIYATQLAQLREMGFIDTEANTQGLLINHGNVDATISWLLERGIGN